MERVRRVLSVPDDYTVLFRRWRLTQFYMTALNILNEGKRQIFGDRRMVAEGAQVKWSNRGCRSHLE